MVETLKLLRIDLSFRTATDWYPPEPVINQYLGGRGLAAALSYRLIDKGCDPLGPQNTLSICNGLLTGTAAPSAARTHFCALSPQTGVLGSSNAGGHFGAALRFCNIQGLVITGTSTHPVYLYIDPEGLHIRPADHLWGLDTRQCESRLKDDLGDPEIQAAVIGPAGETLSAIACIMVNAHSAAGRTGLGAVMGAKRLKAIVIKAGRTKEAASRSAKKAKAAYLNPILQSELFKTLRNYGQSGFIRWCSEMGLLATNNFQGCAFKQAHRICGSSLNGRIKRRHACYGCPIRCKADAIVAGGPNANACVPRPEFETIAALGAKCGQTDMDAVLRLSDKCNRYGLDTISAGASIAFAMALFEKRIIATSDTDGLVLNWGNAAAQDQLLESMALRQGFGSFLADGVQAAAERIGRGSRQFAYHCKGLELCAYDPRASMSTALGYAVSERGGDFAAVYATAEYRWNAAKALELTGHHQSIDRLSEIGKATLVRRCSQCAAVVDALGICKVAALGIPAAFDLKAESELVCAMTGRELTPDDLFVIGDRILCTERLFNLRHWRRSLPMDTLPQVFHTEATEQGDNRRTDIPLARMRAEYYETMGWDPQGRPYPEKRKELGLEAILSSFPV